MSGRHRFCRRGLGSIAGLLAMSLTLLPTIAHAQSLAVPVAMVEVDPADLNFWGFAANVPVGGTVTWTNVGTQTHTVTAVDGSFNTGGVAPGASATVQFSTVGEYTYVCELHSTMKGFLVVSPDFQVTTTVAIVEGDPTSMTTWGFAASLQAGQTIAWTNRGWQPHTATAIDNSFETSLLDPGATAELAFSTPGLYAYYCAPHPWMKGNVLVY
jgi:plastocyanin